MTPNDRVLAWIRTGVPYGIGAALGWLFAVSGLDLRGDFQVALIAFAVVAVTNLYYFAVRIIEARFPWVGVFLGWPSQPSYDRVDNLWASFVRTAIPTLVGALVVTVAAWIAQLFGVALDPSWLPGIIAAAVAVVEALYYAAAKGLLAKWPSLSWLLGTGDRPVYDDPTPVDTGRH